MSYSLFWRSPALPFIQKQTAITVPAGSVVSTASSLRFTGKGATNYGKIQQENMMRLLESFAGPIAPDYATVGQTWYDTSVNTLKVCISTAPDPVTWKQLNATQVTGPGEPPPTPATLGDTWFSQTGTSSGILYAYTGVGRYPQVDWDATDGYWPAPSTTAGIILNAATFGSPNTNYGEAFIHGFSGVTPANVQGSILINGVPTLMPLGIVATDTPVPDGLIVWDQTSTLISLTTVSYFCVRQFSDGRWFYDNNNAMVEFTPTSGMYAVGRMTVSARDVGTPGIPPGVTFAEIWSAAVPLYDIMQVPATAIQSACGGWEQVWPQVETYGGRREYDFMYSQLASLIGDPLCYGGSGGEGRAIQYLTDFKTLDASYQLLWKNRLPRDPNVGTSAVGVNTLRVDPNSNDWDLLLSACRYAVERLELPAGFLNDLSPFPFVQDGRIIPQFLHSFPSNDVRRPPAERFMKERVGAITIMSAYQETVNVMRAAVQNRYTARGLLAASGTGNSFIPSVITSNQASFSASAASFSGTVIHGLQFVFDESDTTLDRFFYSAGALQFVMTHSPAGPVGNDLALKSITDNFGRVRVTADNTYVMTPSPTPTISQAPSNTGFINMLTGSSVVLATMTSGGATIVVRGQRVSPFIVQINIEITPGAATSGTFNVLWSRINDTVSYNNPGPVQVYPVPVPYVASHKQGSGFFV